MTRMVWIKRIRIAARGKLRTRRRSAEKRKRRRKKKWRQVMKNVSTCKRRVVHIRA